MVRKLLRNAGLVLILLPEPFTTPLGLALLGVSYVFARFNRIDTADYLRGFIRMYLKESRLRGEAPGVIHHKLKQALSDTEWSYRPAKDVTCGIDASRLSLRFGKDMNIEFAEPATPVRHNMKQRWAGFVWPGTAPDVRTTATANHVIDTSHMSVRFLQDTYGGSRKPAERVVKHTLDIEKLSLRCDTSSPIVEKAIHHGMIQNLYGYVLPSIPARTESAKTIAHHFDRALSGFPTRKEQEIVHSVNRNGLLRHYEKTMPTRSAVSPEPKVHAFNPAKVSLALGMG